MPRMPDSPILVGRIRGVENKMHWECEVLHAMTNAGLPWVYELHTLATVVRNTL